MCCLTSRTSLSERLGFVFSASFRHERIHTKRGGHLKMQTDADEVNDLATLEVLDEVRECVSITKQ